MSFGSDRVGHEKRCYVCGTPTQSHPAPNGWVCHTCKTDIPESTLRESLDLQPRADLTPWSHVECWWCGEEHAIAEIASSRTILIGTGFHLFDEHDGMVITSCPSCTRTTDHVTTGDTAEEVAKELLVPLHEYDPRKGWVKA